MLQDLYRTFPTHPRFGRDPTDCLIPALRRVLLAYSLRNKRVGYCQVSIKSLFQT